jgi:hypothetical protein
MPDPRYPVYVVSRGRTKERLTIRALEEMGAPYRVIVEADERDAYAAVVDPAKVLVLDPQFQRDYETCDDLGDTKSKGPGPARNFAWAHAEAEGFDAHWVLDDNIRAFYRFHHSKRLYVQTPTYFWVMEEWLDRFENVALAGPQYVMFAPESSVAASPLNLNTRVYSALWIRNDLPYRWRGRYNEDTDLSLRALKDGWATVLFNAFLQQKMWTARPEQTGGNTAAFYEREGTLPKSRMLVRMHPDVARLTWKYGRWHHEVNYKPFAGNRPVRKPGPLPRVDTDEFGLQLVADRPVRSARLREILAAENGAADLAAD